MEDSRNIIKAIDALTLKAGGEVVDSKNITEAIDNLKAVYDQEAIGIDKTLTQEGLAADAKAVGDAIKSRDYRTNAFNIIPSFASNNVGSNKELVVTFSVAGSASNYRGAMLLMAQENLNYGAPSLVMFSWGSDRSNPVVVNKIVGSETVYDDAYIDADTKTLHIPVSDYSSIMAFTIANALSGSTIVLKTKS